MALIGRIEKLNEVLNSNNNQRIYIIPNQNCQINDLRDYYFYLEKEYLADFQDKEVKSQLKPLKFTSI